MIDLSQKNNKHPNSLQAYNLNQENFERMADIVWNTLRARGPMTGAELTLFMINSDILSESQKVQGVNSVRPRLNDLKNEGLVQVNENRECTVSTEEAEELEAVGSLAEV